MLNDPLPSIIVIMECTSDEEAHVLSERATYLRSSYSPVASQLMKDCEQIRIDIAQLKEACARLAPPPVVAKGSYQSLLLQQLQLQTEIAVWKKERPPAAHDVPPGETRRKLEVSREQLKTCLEMVKKERATATLELEREKKYAEETELLLEALKKKVESLKTRKYSRAPDESQQDQLKKILENCDILTQQLESFVEEHLSQGDGKGGGRRKKSLKQTRLTATPSDETKTTLPLFIKELIEKSLDSPHDPYLPVDSIKQDYFLLLLRSGVVQRHTSKPSLIRITPFHH